MEKDEFGEGDLKIPQLREVYYQYAGKFTSEDEFDNILAGCTVQVSKKGMIKYTQFSHVKSRKAVDVVKLKVKAAF